MYNYHFSYPDTCASTFPKKLFIYWELSCLKQRETTKNIKTYGLFFTKNKKLYKFISSAVPQIHPVSPDELYTKHMKRSSTSSIQVIAPLETESTIHWTVYRKTYLSFYNSRYKICSFIRNIFEGFMQFAFFFFGPLHFYIDKYIHVQLNFDVFTIDISNIIDVLKWVKTTVRLYIYLQLLLPLDISKIYVSFGWLPLVPENKILL